jgi:hypothetical protein
MAGLLSISKSDSGFVEPRFTKNVNADDTQARTGRYATFRLAEGPKPRSYHRTGGESYYGRKKQFNLFLQIFYKVNFCCDIFAAEFGLRVDSIVLTI